MKIPENIESLSELDIDFMGFIFYPKSKRYVDFIPAKIPKRIQKVGVFVNENAEKVLETARKNGLHYVQLHGNETSEYCQKLRQKKLRIIKAFSVDSDFDFKLTCRYQACCDYFIFDTKGKNYGGNGVKFNWQLLQKYTGETPFLLSGGISPSDVQAIENFEHRQFAGVDINSGFETEAGLKNILQIEKFIEKLRL